MSDKMIYYSKLTYKVIKTNIKFLMNLKIGDL
jgi:hypothetical protein